MKHGLGTGVPILAYHAIIEDDQKDVPVQWSRRQAVSLEALRSQLDLLASGGWETILPQGLDRPPMPPKSLVITFDGGHASDHIAARELRKRNLQATFFVTCSYLGTPGYLDEGGVIELSRRGFEIGSHGVNQVRLAELAPEDLDCELALSRRQLERIIGKPVTTIAVPLGSYNGKVVNRAIAAGYRAMVTSDFSLAVPGRHVLPRLEVQSRTTLEEFRRLISSNPISIVRMRLSNGIYRGLRRLISIQP